MNKKELLIISNEQFGYHTDSFKYCQYLKESYHITYLCFDKNLPKILEDKIHVIYVPSRGNKLRRSWYFIKNTFIQLYYNKGITFLIYFNGFSIFRFLMPWKPMILDIRTLSVNKNPLKRTIEDFFLRISVCFFSYVTVISYGVAGKLNIPKRKLYILPLGADSIHYSNKDFTKLSLLYVGTLSGRNILETLKGVQLFIQAYPEITLTYDIVGEGDEKEKLISYIETNNLKNVVFLRGFIHHKDLSSVFERCNIGISYVPITNYYNFQPATKTFEYLSAGLYCIATATHANKEIITKENGCLIQDNSESFKNALIEFINRKDNRPDSIQIRNSVKEYTWENIVNVYLQPVINKVLSSTPANIIK
ncbi:MAG: glycosyltransferase [Tannerellaceae bacterium]|nr:glycosyltransferase [Tannerellaceae bacterium]